jgi:hypothetical protein
MVNVQNERRNAASLARGQELWVSWALEDMLILTQ